MDITSILGFLNPINWIEKGIKYLRRPRFRIYFDPDETFHTRRLADLKMQLGYFVHLMVQNTGSEVAKSCLVQVIQIEHMVRSGNFENHPNFLNPVVLKWAHESDLDPRDVDPDLPKRLDLCVAIQTRPQYFSLMTDRTPSGNQIDFPVGTYRIRVRLRAANAKVVDGTFQLTYKGIWNQFMVQQINEE